MTIILKPEQEQLLLDAIKSGLAHTPDEALDQALAALRNRLSPPYESEVTPPGKDAIEAIERLRNFGKTHRLSPGGMTIRELRHEARS